MNTNSPLGVARSVLWSIGAGAAFALVAVVAAPLAQLQFTGVLGNSGDSVRWLSLAAGVFLTASLLWWLLIVRLQRISLLRGAITGVLVALFCYPVVLVLAEISQRDLETLVNGTTIFARALNLLALTALTLLTTGFAATLIMAFTGALVAFILVRLDPVAAMLTVPSGAPGSGGLASRLFKLLGGVAFAIVAILIGGFMWLSLLPFDAGQFDRTAPDAGASPNYAAAIAGFEQVGILEDALALDPRCRSKLLSHGRKTARVVIYFHGLTNCPAQADQLAQQLFAQGYNVYVPRLPGHGMADPLTLALKDMTAEDLVETARTSIELAHGLGDEVVVSGLSAGGTLAAWVAQNRSDVDMALVMSPFLGPYAVPPWAMHAATNLLLLAPNLMVWWDAAEPESDPAMSYAYPRFATRALAQTMRLGAIVDAQAHSSAAAARTVEVLLNAGDDTVNPASNEGLLAAWQSYRPEIALRMLPADPLLPHDIIDPNQPDADTGLVYPVVMDMISTAMPQ